MNVKDCLAENAPELLHLWPQGSNMNESRMAKQVEAMKAIYEAKGWEVPDEASPIKLAADLCGKLQGKR